MSNWWIRDENGNFIDTDKSTSDHRIRSNKQDKAYSEKMNKRIKSHFVWCDNEEVKEVSKHMNLQESGAMFSIMVHLQFNSDGFIIKDGRFVTMTDLEKIIGKSKRQVMTIIKHLESLSLVFRVKQGRQTLLQVNDQVHWIGTKVRERLATKVYTRVSKELVSDLDLNELGLLYKIIPYFHTERMVLCKNVNEQSPDSIEEFTLSELAEEINLTERTLARIMPKLVSKKVLMKGLTGNRTHYIINPSFFFRLDGHTEVTETVQSWFN